MKKFLLALAIGGASLLSFNSCTKEYITNENYLPGVSYVYPIASNDWVKNGILYEKVIPMSQLDARYFEDGHVNVAISFDSNSAFYENIPADLSSFYGNNVYVLHSYSAKYKIGQVIITAEPLGNVDRAPESMITKIVLTDADNGQN